jgi:hypothetical protein
MALMQRYTRSQFINSTLGRPTLIAATIDLGEAEPASINVQGIELEADVAGSAGNLININFIDWIPPVAAVRIYGDITYTADTAGTPGNMISIEYTAGGTAGAEVVSVVGNAISVQIESGVSTATQVEGAVNASIPAAALVNLAITGSPGNAQVVAAASFLAGGANSQGQAGSEVVSVVGNAITVRLQSGVSTVTQVRTAINASGPAAALVNATGTSGATVIAPMATTFLEGGLDGEVSSNGGSLITSVEKTGTGEYTITLDGTYHSMQFAGFQLGFQTPQALHAQITNLDVELNNVIGVTLLNGSTPTDVAGGGIILMKLIMNNSSVSY